jgi:predicted RNase H-like nuclease (RuvC/YqgF family)
MERFRGMSPMTSIASAMVTCIGANIAAAVVSVQTNDVSASTIVGWISATILGLCATVGLLTPVVAKAIVQAGESLIPAIGAFKKRFEEISKETYTGQIDQLMKTIEKLTATSTEMTTKIDDLNETIVELREDNARLRARDEASQDLAERLENSLDHTRTSLHDIRNKLGTELLGKEARIHELEMALASRASDREDGLKQAIKDNTASIDKIMQAGAAAIDVIAEAKPKDQP